MSRDINGIEGIGVLKKVQVAVSGMLCIDLNNDSLKVLGTHFSELKDEENLYKIETDIQLVLKYGKWETLHYKEKFFF